ncbi:response regulator [Chitinasiproducens palmae]|uniref:Response regulator receiver domain-containing protein n=1 Tax=Chitinasiproducens palmae TaxID=1770053 RepID=A0A1H2PSR7_9BURK|nr:response regulator [Chitinasiproducens palmae]SDV50088.1 Response regulator receiver domain-containing protein [Chitinasiproducens palmae]
MHAGTRRLEQTCEIWADRLNSDGEVARVLVVDDFRDLADAVAEALTRPNVRSRCAYSGEQALGLITRWQPHVVLLDLSLPGTDGFKVAEQIARMPGGDRPVLIAHTGLNRAENIERVRALGFSGFCSKPLSFGPVLRFLNVH